jgi:hypothetical protein
MWVYNFCHNDELQPSLHKRINITRAGGATPWVETTLPQGKKKKETKLTCPDVAGRQGGGREIINDNES